MLLGSTPIEEALLYRPSLPRLYVASSIGIDNNFLKNVSPDMS